MQFENSIFFELIIHSCIPKACLWGNLFIWTNKTLKIDPLTSLVTSYFQFINNKHEGFPLLVFFSAGSWIHPPDSLPDQRLQVSPRWQLTQELAVAAGEQTICVPRRSAEHHKTAAIKSETMKRHWRRGRNEDARTSSCCKSIYWLLITIMTAK